MVEILYVTGVFEKRELLVNFGVGKILKKMLFWFTKCSTNDVRHLDFGWSGGMRGPARSGGVLKPSILDLEGI